MMQQLYEWIGFVVFWLAMVNLPFLKLFGVYRCQGCGEVVVSDRKSLIAICLGERMWHVACYANWKRMKGEQWPES